MSATLLVKSTYLCSMEYIPSPRLQQQVWIGSQKSDTGLMMCDGMWCVMCDGGGEWKLLVQYTPDTEIYSLTYAMNISPMRYAYSHWDILTHIFHMVQHLSMVELCQQFYQKFVEYLEELNKFTVDRLSVSAADLRPFLGHYRCEA